MSEPTGKFEKLIQPILRIGVVDRFLHDQSFADLVTLCLGAFGNLVFVVFEAVLWWMDPSPWYGAMTIYFAALVVMGSLVAASTGSNGKLSWRTVAGACGVTLIALAVILAVIMYLCVVNGYVDPPPEFLVIAIAAFTFYNAIVAIITATKTRKGDLRQQTMLRVSIASTIGALLILEMQMFGTYAAIADPMVVFVTEAISGGVGALLLVLMGCSLLRKLHNGRTRSM